MSLLLGAILGLAAFMVFTWIAENREVDRLYGELRAIEKQRWEESMSSNVYALSGRSAALERAEAACRRKIEKGRRLWVRK